jgi:hypothetical protein
MSSVLPVISCMDFNTSGKSLISHKFNNIIQYDNNNIKTTRTATRKERRASTRITTKTTEEYILLGCETI